MSLFSLRLFFHRRVDFGWKLILVIFLFLPMTKSSSNCKTSGFPKGVIIVGTCGFEIQNTCQVGCVDNDRVVWKDRVRCLADGRWSPLAPCEKISPPRNVEPVQCFQVDGTPSKNPAICAKISVQSSHENMCPVLGHLEVDLAGCSRQSGTECNVFCREPRQKRFTIRCLPSGKWSSIPECRGGSGSSNQQGRCPDLSAYNVVPIDCSGKVGVPCKVKCASGYALEGGSETNCLDSGKWFPMPVCKNFRSQCRDAEVPVPVKFMDKSCKKSAKLTCKAACRVKVFGAGKNNIKLVFGKKIRCMPSGRWGSLPNCAKAKKVYWNQREKKWRCPKPKLSSGLMIVKKCPGTHGKKCRVRCRKGLWVKGSKFIKCVKKKWSKIPKCGPKKQCPKLKLPKDMKVVGKCRPRLNAKCRVRCKKGTYVKGSKNVKCLKSGKWSKLPRCTKQKPKQCPKLKLPKNMKLVGKCKRRPKSKCRVKCKKGAPKGGNKVTCLKSGKWSRLPRCGQKNKKQCPKLKLSKSLKLIGKCNRGLKSKCRLRCAKGLLKGKNNVSCLRSGKWSRLPSCQIINGRGEPSQSITESNLQTTESNLPVTESNLPVISNQPVRCNPPPLPQNLKITGTCQHIVGFSCKVQCKAKTDKMVGPSVTTCLSPGSWSKVTACKSNQAMCKTPVLRLDLRFVGDCKNKSPGDKCKVQCKDNSKTVAGDGLISCLNKNKWSPFPKCQKKMVCPVPQLTEPLKTSEDCTAKSSGEKCQIECTPPAVLNGDKFITCGNNGRWSTFPSCDSSPVEPTTANTNCEKPDLPESLKTLEDCSDKKPGELCPVSCTQTSAVLTGAAFVTCLESGTWTPPPTCSEKYCPIPTLVPPLSAREDCSTKTGGQECPLLCRGSPAGTITCLDGTSWSSPPACGASPFCAEPILPDNQKLTSECANKRPGQYCSVTCTEGSGTGLIFCLGSMKWSPPPECSKVTTCPVPQLTGELTFDEDCSTKTAGQKCRLKCTSGTAIAGDDFITCNEGGEWTAMPSCGGVVEETCPAPELTPGLLATEDCSTKKTGENCQVSCSGDQTLVGNRFLTCLTNKQWNTQPTCVPKAGDKKCPALTLPSHLLPVSGCRLRGIGAVCRVKCKEGTTPMGQDSVTCLESGQWSLPFPTCKPTCPPPELPSALAATGDCTTKSVGDSCTLKCREGYRVQGSDKIECQEGLKWTIPPNCVDAADLTCPVILNVPNLIYATKCQRKDGMSCQVFCRDEFILVGSNWITCVNGLWTNLPKCVGQNASPYKNRSCKAPVLPDDVYSARGPCPIAMGRSCYLNCKSSAAFKKGPRAITCLSTGFWSWLPDCNEGTPGQSCPYDLPTGLQFADRCPRSEGVECPVICGRGRVLVGGTRIKCVGRAWSGLPDCVAKDKTPYPGVRCRRPQLPRTVVAPEQCQRAAGLSCNVNCKDRRVSWQGPRAITCKPDKKWTSSPTCSRNGRKRSIRDFETHNLPRLQTGNSTSQCPNNFYKHRNRCYTFTPEILGSEVGQKNTCPGDTVPMTIRSNETYHFLLGLLEETSTPCLWTGVSDATDEGLWKDVEGQRPEFLPWGAGQPSKSGSTIAEVQDCVLMPSWGSYRFFDYSCFTIRCRFMCYLSVAN